VHYNNNNNNDNQFTAAAAAVAGGGYNHGTNGTWKRKPKYFVIQKKLTQLTPVLPDDSRTGRRARAGPTTGGATEPTISYNRRRSNPAARRAICWPH